MIPSRFHEPFEVTKDVGAGATVEMVAAAVGKRLFITSVHIDVTVVGAAGSTTTIETKTGGTDIVKTDATVLGGEHYFFGEGGYGLPSGQGIQAVNTDVAETTVIITGFKSIP